MSSLIDAHRKRVAQRIRLARVTSGLSHDQLGAKVGTSRQHLIKLEKGMHLPRIEMLARIADATGRDLSYFQSDEDDEEADPMASFSAALDLMVRDAIRRQVAKTPLERSVA